MNLKKFINESAYTVTDFAKIVEVTRGHLHTIISKKVTPSPALALRIEKSSGGKVALADLYRKAPKKSNSAWGNRNDNKN